jgi:hypothetical protein
MKSKNIFYLCFLLLTAGCINVNKQQRSDNVPVITLQSIQEQLPDSILFQEPKIVYLETNESSLIGQITKVGMTDSLIFIFDRSQYAVLVFDMNGKFKSKIRRIGQGPQEYVQIADFDIDTINNQIVILCTIPKKVMFFSYEGDYLKEIKNDRFYHTMATDSQNIYLEAADVYHPTNPTYHIDIKNFLDGSSYGVLPLIDNIKNFTQANGQDITSGLSEIHFSRRYDNTVYSIKDGNVIPEYIVDFKRHNMPEHYISEPDDNLVMSECERFQYVFYIQSIIENSRYLVFNTNLGIFIYDRHRSLLEGYRKIVNSRCSDLMDIFAINPVKKTNMIVEEIDLSDYNIYDKKYSKLFVNPPAGIKYDDNPALLFYELKQ